jgi:hypothetical protein
MNWFLLAIESFVDSFQRWNGEERAAVTPSFVNRSRFLFGGRG